MDFELNEWNEKEGLTMERINLGKIEPKELMAGFKARLIHSENMTLAYWEVDAGGSLPAHSHPHEQIVNMLQGEMKFTVAGDTQVLKAGDIVIIPPDAEHSGETITDCRILDVFYPVREDYR